MIYARSDHPTWQFQPTVTRDGRYLVVEVGDGQVGDRGQELLLYADLTRPSSRPIALVDAFEAEYEFVGNEGPVFYVKTSLDAPNKRAQRPEAFGAAAPLSGVLDLLRFQLFGQGAGWEGDYGSPADPSDFQALYRYSPLHNVRPGTRYPATLIVTADHDVRVAPLHSYKFAAALQAAQAGPAPILLRVETLSGHGGGTTLTSKIAQDAELLAFFTQNLRVATGSSISATSSDVRFSSDGSQPTSPQNLQLLADE